jgi:alanyl-tRNA synthetase
MLDGGDSGDGIVGIIDRLFAERLDGNGIAVVLGDSALAVKVGGSALDAGVKAGDLVRAGAEVAGGHGGGNARFARGSVRDKSKRDAALASIREAVSRAVGDS